MVVLMFGALGACRRHPGTVVTKDASLPITDPSDIRCVERPEGCTFCEGRGPPPPLLEPDAPPTSLCDPKDPANCVDFCSLLAHDCATPWWHGPTCLLPSEEEFRRALFRRDTADRPEVTLQARVVDDAGRRVEGAQVRVWFQGASIADELSGKDGFVRIKLRSVPAPYLVRVSHAGHATEITEVRLDKVPLPVRTFRLGPESTIRGKAVDETGQPVGGLTIRVQRSPEDPIEISSTKTADDGQFTVSGLENRRYVVIASGFGWLPGSVKATAAPGPSPRVSLRVSRTGVIRGTVLDDEGDGAPNAIVVAMLSSGFGVTNSPIIWSTDTSGEFAQDRLQPGTYYLWARMGERQVYPPEKVELSAAHPDVRIQLKLRHKGARVRGRVAPAAGRVPEGEMRAVLFGRSPLAFPRKAVADVDKDGRFVLSGVLPGRYELGIRLGQRVLPIVSGPREVEIPIEEGATVDLSETVVVRPRPED